MTTHKHRYLDSGPYCVDCGKRRAKAQINWPAAAVGTYLAVMAAVVIVGFLVLVGLDLPDEDPVAAAPAPAPTPRPSPTPQSCPSYAERSYFEDVESGLVSFGTGVGMFGEQLGQAGNNLWLLLDEDWVFARETDIISLDLWADRLIALQPLSSARDIDRQVEEVMHLAKRALQKYLEGIEQVDEEAILAGADLMSSASTQVSRIRPAMDAFCETR